MNLPITSRIKRSPLLATDPDEKAKATKISKGKKEIVKTSKDVKGAQVEKQATTPEEKAKYQEYLDNVKSGKVKKNRNRNRNRCSWGNYIYRSLPRQKTKSIK